jgi:hypothetical protein
MSARILFGLCVLSAPLENVLGNGMGPIRW